MYTYLQHEHFLNKLLSPWLCWVAVHGFWWKRWNGVVPMFHEVMKLPQK